MIRFDLSTLLHSGFVDKLGTGQECQDVDECHHGVDCGDYSECTNSPGSFTCQCLDGYARSPIHDNYYDPCLDIDECASNSHTCDSNAVCINMSPGFNCSCNEPVWQGDGHNCYYFDPCWNEPCGEYSSCVINVTDTGHFSCPCQAPRLGSGKGPSERCHCPTGYWDKYTLNCVDIDECSIELDGCRSFCPNSRHEREKIERVISMLSLSDQKWWLD